MTTQEAYIRGNNLVAASIVALAGFAFAPEIFLEDEIPFKIDDILLLLLGIGAIVWYKMGNHRYTRSIVPIFFVFASLLVKFGGILVEIKEKDDVGDDFGGLILFILSAALVTWLYMQSKKVLAKK